MMRIINLSLMVLAGAVLGGCGGVPSCNDGTALEILDQNGHSDLSSIVTRSINEEAGHVSCSAIEPGRMGDLNYRVFRTSEGEIVVEAPGF